MRPLAMRGSSDVASRVGHGHAARAAVAALDVFVRLIGLRRLALLAWWLQRGAPTFSFLLPIPSLDLVALLLNAATLLVAPSVALWIALFAPRFDVTWSAISVPLLLAAMAADAWLFWRNWRIQILVRVDGQRAIERQVHRDFPCEPLHTVLGSLGEYRSRRSLRDTQLVHLRLLDVAHGDLAVLREQVRRAVLDPCDPPEWRPVRLWPDYL